MSNQSPRILFIVNVDWFFWSHRLEIARAVKDLGAEVWIATASTGYEERIAREGFRFVQIPFSRSGKNIGQEAKTLLTLFRMLRKVKPDLIHNVTIKPVIYGSWMARLAGCPVVVNAISGLGYIFIAMGWKSRLSRAAIHSAYKCALAGAHVRVIFQNPDDIRDFVENGLVERKRTVLIRGSGVDIKKFSPLAEPEGVPVVMLPSRLLRDKGVMETVEAARLLHAQKVPCRIVLVGDPDPENPASISREELHAWVKEGYVEWWGYCSDMEKVLPRAAIVVLPSYREGLPKVLLEAASVGRPIVATDVPGCREVVREGENGFLVPPRDHVALARAIQVLVEDPEKRKRMGVRSRELAVNEFRVEKVVADTLSVYEGLLGSRFPNFFATQMT